jgi:hypothetical protein
MFLNISQPIPTMMLFILRKNVQLAKFQSEFFLVQIFFGNLHLLLLIMIFSSFGSDLPVQSTAVFVIAVLLVLTTIVDGW